MSRYFNLDSLAINFQSGDSDKQPFVFVHGNTQNDTCGRGVLEYFKHRKHPILSYDLPGHGDSILDTSDYIFTDLIDLNQEILNHYELANPILCGHSLGGMIQAGTIAQFGLNDASLILCGSYDGNPISFATKTQSDVGKAMDQVLDDYVAEGKKLFKKQFKYDYFTNKHIDEDSLRTINRQYTQPSANETNLKTLGDFSARETLVKFGIPVLVLHGEEEEVIPKSLIESMASEYEKIRLAWYIGKGHCAFYQQPELTRTFLDEHYSFLTES